MTAPALADRVKETTATTGTGTVTLAGAAAGYRAFNGAITSGGSCYYCLESGTDWEVGIGTFTHGGSDTLSRDTVLASSAGGTTKITLAGTSNVFVTRPAAAIVPAASAADLPIVTHSAGYTLVTADRGGRHQFTGSSASTCTLPSAATVGAGWWCIVENAMTGSTGVNKTLSFSGTLDGVTNPAAYPGDIRIIQSDGSALYSILLVGGYLELVTADSPFTLKIPTGAPWHHTELWGGGGSGASGNSGAAGGQRAGGSGAGGGAFVEGWWKTSDLSTSQTVTIAAAQSTVGNAVTNTTGSNGTVGNNTTFGSLLTAYGGGPGFGGQAALSSGGAGGGWMAAGGTGGTGGSTGGGAVTAGADGNFNGGGGPAGNSGRAATYGGGAGGGAAAGGLGNPGGCSAKGGPGGGPGGGVSSGNSASAGANGGSGPGALSGGGVSGGNAGTSGVDGGSPSAASQASTAMGPGLGGGGGGSGFDNTGAGTASNGGAGGDGGIAAGGGGGGAALSTKPSGPGGRGGPGLFRYRYGP